MPRTKKTIHTIAEFNGFTNFKTHCGLDITGNEIDKGEKFAEVIEAGATKREISRINCLECVKKYHALLQDEFYKRHWKDYSKIEKVFAEKIEKAAAEEPPKSAAEKIQAAAEKFEGFTADSNGNILDIKSGFAVSVKDFGEDLGGLLEYVKKNNLFIGFWKDAKTGKRYFDAVDIVEKRETAIEIGKQTNQIAIWDFARFEEIRIAY